MVGVSTSFVSSVIDVTVPSLRSLVEAQFGDRVHHEWPTINGWLHTHGVTAVVATNGNIYFMPGMSHDMSDLEDEEVALIYGYTS